MSNTVKTSDDIEIYLNRMYQILDEYTEELEDKTLIYDVNVYGGLLKRIYRELFKPSKHDKVLNNTNTKLDLKDIYSINEIWEQYTDIASRCKKPVFIEDFCLLTGIHRATIYNWANGDYRNQTSNAHLDTAKKWLEDAKTSRLRGASTGNVGMIFLCKAVDGMAETAPVQIEDTRKANRSPEQIMQRFSNAELPEKPNFDE